jgi:hypothetical protein
MHWIFYRKVTLPEFIKTCLILELTYWYTNPLNFEVLPDYVTWICAIELLVFTSSANNLKYYGIGIHLLLEEFLGRQHQL